MLNSLLALSEAGLLTPTQASTMSERIDGLFLFIVVLCTFFFILIVGMMTYFVLKYRRRSDADRTHPVEGNLKLEIVWSVIPAILLVVIFVWGFKDFVAIHAAPSDTMDIRVTAQKWAWSFQYPEGIESGELVVPVNRPVKLTLASRDVIHSFFVPAFRLKQDAVPNRYTTLWFEAKEPGEYNVFCAEYCGTEHSNMRSKVIVKSKEDYQEWVDKGGPLGEVELPSEKGRLLFGIKGCNQCHSVEGETKTGPHLNGKYGSQEQTSAGTITINDNYIHESILNPGAKIVQGFSNKMPTYKGRIKDEEIEWLIEYLKSIGK